MDIKILTPNGYERFDGINKHKKYVIKIVFVNNLSINVSLDHKFVVKNKIKIAKDLKKDDFLEHKSGKLLKIKRIISLGITNVYDIVNIGKNNVYYTNDILSHNCQFIGSTTTLIKGEIIESLVEDTPIEIIYNGYLNIYEKPEEKENYIIGIDPAEGTGNDYSVVQVLKFKNELDIKQVAVYRCNTIDIHDFAQVCIGISKYYHECLMMIENNSIGSALATSIWYEYEYDRIVNTDNKGIGTRSTKQSKQKANLILKRKLENNNLKIIDEHTITELSNYEEIKPGIYRSKNENIHDDTITSLIWALYFFETPFYDKKSLNKKLEKDYMIEPETQFIHSDDIDLYDNNGGFFI